MVKRDVANQLLPPTEDPRRLRATKSFAAGDRDQVCAVVIQCTKSRERRQSYLRNWGN